MIGEPDWGSVAQALVAIGWRTFWQAGLVAAALFVAFRILKHVPAGARMLLWWLVCLKFVLGPAWVQPIALPVLSPSLEVPQSIDPPIQPAPLPADAAAPLPPHWFLTLPWLEYGAIALAALWLAGLMVQVPFLLRQLLRARALRRRGHAVEGEIRSGFEVLSLQAGLRRAPDLLASPEVETPHVSGLWRPTVLIPEDALTRWSPAELTMALGHELVHVRHKDLWHGLVPSIAGRLFFFHPLARLAAREYGLAREVACDGRTLALTGAEPADYAQLLLRFGVTSRPMAAVGGASKTFQILKRRLDMLHDSQMRTLPWRWWGAALVVGLVTVPFQLTARDAGTTSSPVTSEARSPEPEPSSAEAQSQQPAEVLNDPLRRTLEVLRQRQRDVVAEIEVVKLQRALEQQRGVETEAIERAKQQQRESKAQAIERTGQQQMELESRATELAMRRQREADTRIEIAKLQRQIEADAAQATREATVERMEMLRLLQQQLQDNADQIRSVDHSEMLRKQLEEMKKQLDFARSQLERRWEAETAAQYAKELEKAAQDLQNRTRERATDEPQVDLGARLKNVELEVKRLADLLERLRDQLVPKK